MTLRILVISSLISAVPGWAQKPIQLPDILSWKRIQAPAVSNDGEWLAYRVSPAEGDAEVVIRNLKSGKELRFPIGDPGAAAPSPDAGAPPAAPPAATGSALAIAGNSRWAAFQVYPNTRDAKKLKKDRKPIQTKVVLVELATGKKTEFDKTRRFAFSGEKATALALHRYPADAPPAPPAAPGSPAADRPSGSDLLLYDLAAGSELNLGNVGEFAFDKKGEWLACLVDARDKAGNGVMLRNMATGSLESLDHAEAVYKGLTWTEKGDGLAT
ncbi:MAG: S9 family peptidase, partial [Candidatus Solibacter sp.]|nr:S9 family peptidase [Candidatus Solibacter sp.]